MRILLTRTDRVGDLILTTPAIASIRRSFPAAHVTLACSRYNSVVVTGSQDVDDLALYAENTDPRLFGEAFRGVDLAVALAPRSIDHAIVAATRAPVRVGYTYRRRYLARLGLRFALTRTVLSDADPAVAARHPERPVMHEVDQVLAVAQAAGATQLARDLVLPLSDGDRAAAPAVPPGAILVQLGRRWTERGSTTASTLELLRELRALGRPVVATYGDDAEALGGAVRECGLADGVYGGLSFGAWAATFAQAACVVTIDTGATHVASAVRVPVVVLYEHQWFELASREWSPYRVPNAILRKPADETEGSLRASRSAIVAAVSTLL